MNESQQEVSAGTFEASAVRIELGRCWLAAQQAGSLRPGSVIELDSGLEDSVEIFAGGRLLGRGQAVTVNGKVAVKVEETCPAGAER